MKTLDILLIRESNMEIVGKVQLYEIGELTDSNPIKGYCLFFFLNIFD
jgi:hypothetical protein